MDFNNVDQLEKLKQELVEFGIVFDKGLTDPELFAAEEKFKFKFPPDLKSFLKFSLPKYVKGQVRDSFPNWRKLDEEYITEMMNWPLEGIFFDIEGNDFWLKSLGPKTSDIKEALRVMEDAFSKAPKLIPIWGHRFIPDTPVESNNPVLSVYGTDIIYYGANLYDYFQTEMRKRPHLSSGETIKPIAFWKEIIDYYITT